MLEMMASPDWVRWVSLALVVSSAAVLVPGIIRGWAATALAFGLLCAVLAVLASSHYLLFNWASQWSLALPGLLLGLPLIYLGSIGLLARRQPRRPLGATLVLAGGVFLLFASDSQQLWPATFYRLQGALLDYPELVLHSGEDLGEYLPPAGTRLIFKPADQTLSCGLSSDPEPSYASLSYRLDCRNYYWGPAMIAPEQAALDDLPVLHGLANLWSEAGPGNFFTLTGVKLFPAAMAEFELLCPADMDCQAGKQAIMQLLGYERWDDFRALLQSRREQLLKAYEASPAGARNEAIAVLAEDVRAQLEKRVAVIVAVYAEAQARSLTLSDLAPSYSRPAAFSSPRENSAAAWNGLVRSLRQLPVSVPANGTLSRLQNAVLLAAERQDGGVRLVYHTEVGRHAASTLVLFLVPLLWLVLVLAVMLWRCLRPGGGRLVPWRFWRVS
ncbi:hypothetical protein [Pseudomonas yangonensis]|uniref:hypothetical protein n=1 Tax=Pseudomonas yangonensis TaxID=2579922 RepID=UPI001F43D29E|nr:hypothetical protein [Pseudomonas yangonensis]